MTQIPEKIVGGEASTQEVLNFLTDKFNNLIDHLTARQELEDTRYKELTSRLSVIPKNQLEMKRGDQPIFQDIAPEEQDQPKRWRAEIGSKYWWVSWDGNVLQTEESEDDSRYDNWNYNTGNYHPTREAAEAYKAKLLADNQQ